jgi:cytochrome c oxidase cbb3-type subunit 1
MTESGQGGNGTAAAAVAAEKARYALERARIDESCRLPVIVWFCSGVFWLLVGSALAVISSVKLHSPESMFPDTSWLTFGRARAAHLSAVSLGWSFCMAIGVSVWQMCRLARCELIYPKILVLAAVLWNIGTLVGVVGILAGYGQSVEWLDMPPVVAPFFVAGLGITAAWTVATFRNRRENHVYVTQWYLLAAMFWMPWLYVTAILLIFGLDVTVFGYHLKFGPGTGVVQATTNWWFAHNVLGLWITPVGVGTAYYLIPKVIGRPVYSYYLSVIGFWALALFYSWAGMHHLIGGPIPAWMASASVVGSMMMLIPVGAVALNHHMTMKGHFRHLRYSPTLRFVVFGAIAYTAVSVQGALESLKSFSEVAHFTHYTVGHAHLGVYGFFAMIMFGATYYIMPRLTGREWASGRLIRLHFWLTAVGITMYFTALSVGGWFQGLALIDADVPFIQIVRNTLPYLWARSVAGSLMVIGHVVFAALVVMNVWGVGKPRVGPTYFVEPGREPRPARAAEAVAS